MPTDIPINPKCFANHLGVWAIEPEWFSSAVAAVQAGTWPITAVSDTEDDGAYIVTQDGIAVIEIAGQIMRGQSKFGGASSLETRRLLRKAVTDPSVQAILLRIDSPGGNVVGIHDLAQEVRAADSRKPVYAQADESAASAAYWVAAQARQIFGGPTAEVGSIGALSILYDTSGAAAMDGVKIHVVASGPYKGLGVRGTPVTEEQIAYARARVEDVHALFLDAVAGGRKMAMEQVQAAADGRMYIAAKAQAMGLIDGVKTLDETMSYVRDRMQKDARRRAASQGFTRARQVAAEKVLDNLQ